MNNALYSLMTNNSGGMDCRLEHGIKLARFEHLLSDVKVKLLGSIDKITFSDRVIGPGSKGEVIEVPLAIARILVDSGLAEFMEREIKAKEIRVLSHTQKTRGRAKPLEKLFYQKALSFVSGFSKTDAGEAKRTASELLDLVDKRIKIIARMAFAGMDEEAKENLTLEEYHLYASLKRLMHRWRDVFLEVMRNIE